MSPVRCSVCEKSFEPNESRSLPFCSERCRMVDLHHWLDEDYGLPDETERAPRPPDEE
ncbi:MAG: DNA gyrase inhibitor YacG [Candidatus Nealsonbacteria bacterium]|nr:DNA gyrase inhibitor YacG [Candidatus Nealsonbacteria bacterium]